MNESAEGSPPSALPGSQRPVSKREWLRELFGGSSDVVGVVGLIVFVLVVLGAALALVRVTNESTAGDTASAADRSSVTMPSDSDTFGSPEDVDGSPTGLTCGPGRVDLLTASQASINAVRGLRQTDVAERVVANREFLAEPADLVRIGISDALVSRILLSNEACIGEIAPDDSFPTTVCAPDDVDINTAFLSELTDLQGIDEQQAAVLIDTRPFLDVYQIAATEGVAERTITWLALNGTCLRQINTGVEQAALTDCSERVDLTTASLDEIADVRGLYQLETAEIVATNQSTLTSIEDLVDIGVDPGRVGRLLLSHEACFGDVSLDEELPVPECAAGDLDLNGATIIDVLDTEGISHDTADLLVFNRPFTTAQEIADIPDLPDTTLTWLAIRDSCLGDGQAVEGLCAPGRIDIQQASLDELVQMRGTRRKSIANLIFANRLEIDGLESLLDLGVEPTVAGKILTARQACFGDRAAEDDLPGETCGPLGLDLNAADISELITLDGLTHLQADLIIAARPLESPADLLEVRGLDPKTAASLAVLEACIEPGPAQAG